MMDESVNGFQKRWVLSQSRLNMPVPALNLLPGTITSRDQRQYEHININWAKMAGDSKPESKRTSECKSPSSSNTVQEQPESAKPDSTRWYVTDYRLLTPSPIAASSTVPVKSFLERPTKARPTFGKLSPASTDLPRVAKRRRVASRSGSSNAADDESTNRNTPREGQSRLLVSSPELGKQPNAGKRGRVSSPRPSGMSKPAEHELTLSSLAGRETLSVATITKLGHLLGGDAIGDAAPAGWLKIANPFNYPWEFLATRRESTIPLKICIPRFINSQETLEFMGFEPSKAEFVFKAFRGWSALSTGRSLDLLWCAMQYVATMEEEANKEGCFDQRKIKERMGFHWGTTLFYIDTGVPAPTGTFFYEREGRVINHVILRISRRYEFLVALENGINNTGMMAWSTVSVPRTLNFVIPARDVGGRGMGEVDQAGLDLAKDLFTEGK